MLSIVKFARHRSRRAKLLTILEKLSTTRINDHLQSRTAVGTQSACFAKGTRNRLYPCSNFFSQRLDLSHVRGPKIGISFFIIICTPQQHNSRSPIKCQPLVNDCVTQILPNLEVLPVLFTFLLREVLDSTVHPTFTECAVQ